MYIPRETIDSIRDRADIVEIVKKYVPSLKKKGKNHLGLCPFHKEKTPSFTVNQEKQIFYCFGCHEGGNVFTFISKIERLDFPDSVRFLGDQVGIQVKDGEKRDTSKRDVILKINSLALEAFHSEIKKGAGSEGYRYITNRGISRESIDTFTIGYAPDSWDFLKNVLTRSRVSIPLAGELGLFGHKDRGSEKHYYDKFRNRVMFPIFDLKNRVVGFGGRIIGDEKPKYINSSESDVYKKRDILYGLSQSRDYIAEVKRAIVVEGYLDVIGCYQHGVRNVVAPLGTSLTLEQLKILSRFCEEVVLLFDADSAGMKAAMRSLEISAELNIRLKVGALPGGDPFDYVKTHGAKKLLALVDSAVPPVEFRIRDIAGRAEKLGKVNTLLQLFGVLKGLSFETERSEYIKLIANLLNVDENSVRTDYLNHVNPATKTVARSVEKPGDKKENFLVRGYREIVQLMGRYPEIIEKAVIDISESEIPDDSVKNVYKKIIELYYSDEEYSIDKLFDFFTTGSEMEFLLAAMEKDFNYDDPGSVYTELLLNMRRHAIDRKIEMTKRSSGTNILAEIEILVREKEKLSNYLQNRVKH